MNRGPMALFGAIVAVGLGPALWLGAQFGVSDVSPTRPPAATIDQVQAPTGGGAGAAPDHSARVLDATVDDPPGSASVATSAPSAATDRSTRTPVAPTVPPRTRVPASPKPSASSSTPVTVPPTESTDPPAAPADPDPPVPDPVVGAGVTLASR
jgi:hypothetical protein